MLCMLFIVSKMLLPVDYLQSMSCGHYLPLYVWSSTKSPRAFHLFCKARKMSGLWC